jgi:crotonobetainyl-CoA:carnitine CoA-transferase CaiB-like acyl-CoA transferase
MAMNQDSVGPDLVDTADDGPLAGVRVLDLTHVLAGPFATQLLADAGATIVKVEPPGGEYARVRGPRRIAPDGATVSAFHAAINRGKRSISLDLRTPSGLEVFDKLVATADVVIENFAPGALARRGVDFPQLRQRFPRLITVSISLYGGFEYAGELATRGGLAIVAEAESSVGSMTRTAEGTPLMLGMPLGDMATGLTAYGAIVTTLFERHRTGRGRHLDISMVKALLSLNSVAITGDQIAVDDPRANNVAAYGIFACADGFVAIGVNSDLLFGRIAGAMDRPDLAQDPRYATFDERDSRIPEINEIVSAWAAQLSVDTVVTQLSEWRVPSGRVATPGSVLADEQLRKLGMFQEIEDGLGATIEAPANPMRFSYARSGLPRLNAHSREILAEIGVADDEFQALAAAGAFGQSG